MNKLMQFFNSVTFKPSAPSESAEQTALFPAVCNSVCGRAHTQVYANCQDYSEVYCDDRVTVIAISDGCSSANAAREAAVRNVKAAIEFCKQESVLRMKDDAFCRKLVDAVNESLYMSEADYGELCATLAVVAVFHTGEYILANIGDGTILSLSSDFRPQITLAPFNDGDAYHTIFTNQRDKALHTMQFKRGNCFTEEIYGFLALTDGAEVILKNMQFGIDVCESMAQALLDGTGKDNVEHLTTEIAAKYTADDVTAAMLVIPNREDADEADEPEEMPDEAEVAESDDTQEGDMHDMAKQLIYAVDTMFDHVDPKYWGILLTLCAYEDGLFAAELVEKGCCDSGMFLETVIPLIRAGLVQFHEDGRFYCKERM